MHGTSDAWPNQAAVTVLNALNDRGIEASVVAGRLRLVPADVLTPEDVAAIQTHRVDLMLMTLVSDDRTLDRLAGFQSGRLVLGASTDAGHCHTCAEPHEDARRIGPCGWCRLAAIQYRHQQLTDADVTTGTVPDAVRLQAAAAVLSPHLLALFPFSISGNTTTTLFSEVA
jgi:hypothetical protein